jgi:hypothetical protein
MATRPDLRQIQPAAPYRSWSGSPQSGCEQPNQTSHCKPVAWDFILKTNRFIEEPNSALPVFSKSFNHANMLRCFVEPAYVPRYTS